MKSKEKKSWKKMELKKPVKLCSAKLKHIAVYSHSPPLLSSNGHQSLFNATTTHFCNATTTPAWTTLPLLYFIWAPEGTTMHLESLTTIVEIQTQLKWSTRFTASPFWRWYLIIGHTKKNLESIGVHDRIPYWQYFSCAHFKYWIIKYC